MQFPACSWPPIFINYFSLETKTNQLFKHTKLSTHYLTYKFRVSLIFYFCIISRTNLPSCMTCSCPVCMAFIFIYSLWFWFTITNTILRHTFESLTSLQLAPSISSASQLLSGNQHAITASYFCQKVPRRIHSVNESERQRTWWRRARQPSMPAALGQAQSTPECSQKVRNVCPTCFLKRLGINTLQIS